MALRTRALSVVKSTRGPGDELRCRIEERRDRFRGDERLVDGDHHAAGVGRRDVGRHERTGGSCCRRRRRAAVDLHEVGRDDRALPAVDLDDEVS
jgi:hypothetical protein